LSTELSCRQCASTLRSTAPLSHGTTFISVNSPWPAQVGRITPGCLGLYSDENESALAEVIKHCRSLNPHQYLPIAIQLGHAGRKGSSYEPWNGGQQVPLDKGGWEAVAPSAVTHLEGELAPREITAVQRSERLGIDAIEMHAAHGYLLHEFLSPVANHRSDEYGGSLENRMRYPLEVFAAMRAAWPEDKPLGVRLSASDWDSQSSWDINESIEFSIALAALGADWIDVSSGGASRNQKITLKPGYQVHFAEAIKKAVDIPVMAVGLITEAQQAEDIIGNGQADMVALARGLLYNPRWVWHAAAQLGATVSAPPQYWRSAPHGTNDLYGEISGGQR